ncbi:hypothetical protein YC2023_016061 [Brassica napus]
MYDRTEDRFNGFEKRIVMHADAFVASGLYEEQVDPAVASQNCMSSGATAAIRGATAAIRVAKRPQNTGELQSRTHRSSSEQVLTEAQAPELR